MSADVIIFVPKADRSAERNITAFVQYARNELTIFGEDLRWDAVRWDISGSVRLLGKSHRVTLNFYSGTKTDRVAFADPWADFARAYVRYLFGLKPSKTLDIKIIALRGLITAISRPLTSLAQLRPDDFDRAAALIREKYSPGVAYNYGKELANLAVFLSRHQMLSRPFEWRNVIPRPSAVSGHIRVGQAFNARREKLMPSAAALDRLPELYRKATSPSDVMALSILALLHVAPMRISELLSLPVDCEHEETGPDGTVYGLRWLPVKGAEPQIKWVPKVWVTLAKESLSKIRALTDEGRAFAAWYAEHDDVYLRPECAYKGSPEATQSELAELFGLARGTTEARLNKGKVRARKLSQGSEWVYDVTQAKRYLAQPLPAGFPVLDPRSGLQYADALFCTSKGFGKLHQQWTIPYPMAITQGWLSVRIAERNDNQKTLFERHGIVDDAGKPLSVTSHQFRHWLNTLAQREGLGQLDIAAWSGRADVRQNEAYDHVPASELHAQLQRIRTQDHAHLTVRYDRPAPSIRSPMTRFDFLKAKYPAAHTTDLGMCVHDFSLMPCQQHGDCFNCNEHTIVKGEASQKNAAKQRLEEAELLLVQAQSAHLTGTRGADRWLDRQFRTVERLQNIVRTHDDDTLDDGTLVELSVNSPDSELRHALTTSGHEP